MNGVHDLGGLQCFGPILREDSEPYFHEAWEERVFGLFFGCFAGGHFNVDMLRAEIERMPGDEYLRSSYYEHWLHAIESLLLANGTLTREALAGACQRGGVASATRAAPTRALPVEMVEGLLRAGASTRMPDVIAPAFKTGDAVIARNWHPLHHTRLPRYARGRRGVVQRDHGVFSFNDTVAHGLGSQPQHVYSVRFAARELWGEQASAQDTVCIDLFESYLQQGGVRRRSGGRST